MWTYLSVPQAAEVAASALAGMVTGPLLGRLLVAAVAASVRRVRLARAEARAARWSGLVPEWPPRSPLARFMATAETTRRAAA